jgi:sigma-B regulation protein RsbU (phosphoserine phosphatase)
VNDELSDQNREAMFVTLFAGILDLDSGEFSYTNAGHNPSYLVKVASAPKRLENIHGIPLGIFAGKRYDQDVIHLDPGDFLFMYTDGVTDSRNEKKEFFGDHRLAELILSNKKEAIKAVVEHVFAGAEQFGGDAQQYDDTTAMALKYKGK